MTKEELLKDYMQFVRGMEHGTLDYEPEVVNDKYMDLLYELVSDTFEYEIDRVRNIYANSIDKGDEYVSNLLGHHVVDLIASCKYYDDYMQFFKDYYDELEDVWNILAEIFDGIAVEARKAYMEVAEDAHDTLVDKGVINDD